MNLKFALIALACVLSYSLAGQESREPDGNPIDIKVALGDALPDPTIQHHDVAVPIQISVTNHTAELISFSAANWKQGMGITVYSESDNGQKRAIFPIAKPNDDVEFAGDLRLITVQPGKTERFKIFLPVKLLKAGDKSYLISIMLHKGNSNQPTEITSSPFPIPAYVQK